MMLNLSQKCSLSNTKLLTVCKQAVHTKYWTGIDEVNTFDKLFTFLLSKAYTIQEQTELRNKILMTKQQNYEFIEQYKDKLEDLITVLGIIS